MNTRLSDLEQLVSEIKKNLDLIVKWLLIT